MPDLSSLFRRNEPILIVVLIAAVAVFGAVDARFLSTGNIVSILQQSAVTALIAFAMTTVILTKGIDISVGSTLAFAGICGGLVFQATGSAALTIMAALGAGAAMGLLNGLLIGFSGISPFIATLATMAFARGFSLNLSGASSIPINDPVLVFAGRETLGVIPVSVVIAGIALVAWWFVLTRTTYGRWIYATGGSASAARASMVPVQKVRVSAYVILGLTAGVGAVLTIGRLGSAQPLAGTGLEFTAITAAIIGGTKLSGGEGSIWGTAIGALLLGVINTGLSFLQVPQTIIYFVTAFLVLIAVLLSQPETVTALLKKRRRKIGPAAEASEDAAHGHVEGHSLELRGLGKEFPGVKALDGVSFAIRAGEVVALAGENGAGKSTLVKCISGIYRPDEGEIVLDGQPVRFQGANDAKGIAVIHQHFSLAPDLTVLENLFLGREPRTGAGMLDRRRMKAEAERIMAELELDIDVTAELQSLTVGRQQMVEIARAVLSDAWLFVMDEPTSALSNRERDRLYEVIAKLKARGAGILYISHKMEEIFSQCDRVVVMRDGRYIGTRETSETTESEIVSMMVGRDVGEIFPWLQAPAGEVAVKVDGISDGKLLKEASLHVRQGEVLALAGLMSSGRSEVLRLIAGLSSLEAGSIEVFGKPQSGGDIKEANRNGVVYIPEDRHLEGFVGTMTVRDNLSLAWLRGNTTGGILSWRAIGRLARDLIQSLGVRPAQPEKRTGELSGGNQQKVVIGKWLATKPRVILLDEPTRGVDVGAKSELHRLFADLKKDGAAIIMVSSELPEVLGVADRIVVMCEGHAVGELPRGATEEDVMRLALGDAKTTRHAAE
ncbi:ATP-binding cassette domain-containing protein [Psychromarinibacter halotolerans]|uniref:ATP-binding cassette domain-containing protein n=1 Tax=Psychromarinibacter halotolerans TaxID=1775175 RepID=A0ABV7GWN5_9RHOB|nr:ATP-binding cassette domain-containing protein [Psychromarinibacter halotolerans]MDF0598541.1 ATP-binding cassette domain-containing protein [Psychromarinibacter halotolerans]